MGFGPEWPPVEVVQKWEEEDENKSLRAEAEIEPALEILRKWGYPVHEPPVRLAGFNTMYPYRRPPPSTVAWRTEENTSLRQYAQRLQAEARRVAEVHTSNMENKEDVSVSDITSIGFDSEIDHTDEPPTKKVRGMGKLIREANTTVRTYVVISDSESDDV
jgi:hypothetical protein